MAPGRKADTGAQHAFRVDDNDFGSTFARTVASSSKTGRKRQADHVSPLKGRNAWEPERQWKPIDNHSFALDSDGGMYDMELNREPYEGQHESIENPENPAKKKKRSKRSRRPGIWWLERYRAKYLDEMIRNDGRGDFTQPACVDCLARGQQTPGAGTFRCKECFLADLTCKECCVRRHRANPLHRIERWSNSSKCFQPSTLQSLGLIIRLNHHFNPCPSPHKSHQKFQILHVNGIHNVTVEFCDCERKIEPYLQLLRRRIYPATQSVIKTCATFHLLEHLHLLSLVAKGGTKGFYKFLEKSTNNSGVDIPKSRYRILQRMLVQWRHLKMLKRAGRGHVEDGISKTEEGQLAVPCPSCPRPGINLYDDWQLTPVRKRYLYSLIVCVDFNFRLKGQLVSSWTRDPGMGDGWAYFVPRQPYETYIKKHVDEEDVSTCVGFAALAQRNSRSTKGLRYTGVGAAVCGRSEMVMANGVANLEKGERYSNSDFMLGYALKVYTPFLLTLVIAYDIACQWMAKLAKRMKNTWDEELKIPQKITTIPVIPKFHHPAHREEDHDQFNCNFVKGLGLSDCECCERLWSVTNGAAASTKPMGPGSRLVVLNDHFGFYNWGKYIGMGATLARRYVSAVKERNQQEEAHRGLTDSLPDELRDKWEGRCREWEDRPWNQKTDTPFRSTQEYMSVKAVEEELKIYENERMSKNAVAYHKTSASSFLVLGLELEQGQRTIRALARSSSARSTTAGKAIGEQRSVLRKKIQAWAQIRPIYMPGLLGVITESGDDIGDGSNDDINSEDIQIWMPSAVPLNKRTTACIDGLVEMESKLREAQCHDDLDGIRHTLRLKSRMLVFKHRNISGQRDGVKSRTVINNVHDRAKLLADSYRQNRKALVSLVTEERIDSSLKALKDADVRSYTDPERVKAGPGRRGTREDEVDEGDAGALSSDDDGEEINLISEDRRAKGKRARKIREKHGTGETHMVNSWIWTTGRINRADGNDEDDELLLEVWAKSRARAERAAEEVELLREEMQRTLKFLTWKGKWWRDQAEQRKGTGRALEEGLRAYAYKQERIQLRLESEFKRLWSSPLHDMEAEAEAAVAAAEGEDERDNEDDDDGDDEDSEGDDDDGENDEMDVDEEDSEAE